MLFTSHYAQFVDSNGDPLSGGVVKFFEPGTSTPKDVYSDGDLTTSIGSEVTLDSAGRAVIFLDGNYKVTLEDSAGVEVKTVDDVNVQDDPVSLVLTNPSFETAGDNATDIPGWTLSAPSGVTVERITTDSYHGAACLEITSDGTNAGYAETTDFISVSPGREYEVSFALESSSAAVTNTVQVRWFDESQSLVSTTSVYNESSGNPTSWESKAFSATPPATARYAKLRAQLGATAGTTRYDDFGLSAVLQGVITNEGTTLPAILSDEVANRPSAGTEGRWFYATDEGRLYRDDGSAWERLFTGQEQRVELGGSFDADSEVVCVRQGNVVTITSVGALTHSSQTFVASDTGAIPSDFRPSSDNTSNLYVFDVSGVFEVEIATNGTFITRYRDWSGTSASKTGTGLPVSITYVITANVT